mmetsp:Transcript_29565/g.95466  ORF Transcript_29565/g.95466 Transcript_29565/m.95466 type:complete len:276 (-) Transcript_29565:719-1546(-)
MAARFPKNAAVLATCMLGVAAAWSPAGSPVPSKPPMRMTRLRGGSQQAKMVMGQYAGDVASLFNNMITPASILAGSLVPLGYLAPLPPPTRQPEPAHAALLRKIHLVIATASLCSELLAVTWATVAVNKLVEMPVSPAVSAWALIQRDFELQWMAVNAHFVLGMLGFMSMVAARAYLTAIGTPYALAASGFALSGLLLMLSVVNRGVASGGGNGMRFGSSVLALVFRYAVLLLKQAMFQFGLLEMLAIGLSVASTGAVVGMCVREIQFHLRNTKK